MKHNRLIIGLLTLGLFQGMTGNMQRAYGDERPNVVLIVTTSVNATRLRSERTLLSALVRMALG